MARAWVLLAAPLLVGCGVDREVLNLTDVCPLRTQSDACYVRFDAEITSGVSADMMAVRLGPNGGELHIQLARIPAANRSRWNLDALAASTRGESDLIRTVTWGACGTMCPTDPADVSVTLVEDYNWASVVDDLDGMGGGFNQPPPDAELILSGANIDIIALRTPGVQNNNYY